ncbi:MAG: carboxylate--amine ligase [Clostridia bacterium]|nr:carboxylate--amine ligase [Clostridia bacterium]
MLILGTDANAYYLARCYHECYGEKAHLLGHSFLPFTGYSDILTVTYDQSIWEEQGFLNALLKQKEILGKQPTVVISSNETYAGFLSRNRSFLTEKGFLFNYPDPELLDSLMYKEQFYRTYQDSVIDLPETYYYDCSKEEPLPEALPFPLVVKPSNVILYNHLSFAGKNKIYKLNNREELEATMQNIKNGGYDDCLILQKFIDGDDSYLFDAVAYCDRNGKVCFLSFAQIGLQEQTRSMVGNAAVLINGYNQFGQTKEVTDRLRTFLEQIGYRGFAEFDLKYDRDDGKFKVLEINARQGRSSYYLTPLGCNLIQILVEDLVHHRSPDYRLLEEKLLLSFVPRGIIKRYIKNGDYRKEALKLWQKRVHPLCYAADRNKKRKLYLIKRHLRYYRDYRQSYWRVD